MPKIIIASPFLNIENSDCLFVPTMAIDALPQGMNYHADLQFHYLYDGSAVVCPEAYDYYVEKLSGTGIKIIKGKSALSGVYPGDIAYNVARVSKKYALHRADKTDEIIKESFEKQGVTLINTAQGYTKCSVAPVSDGAFITSDKGIYKACAGYDMDILLIREGHIDLPPYKTGFIGGCCGLSDNKTMLFCGGVNTHPDKDKILKFLEKYNVTPICTNEKTLFDIGSIICIY